MFGHACVHDWAQDMLRLYQMKIALALINDENRGQQQLQRELGAYVCRCWLNMGNIAIAICCMFQILVR